MNTAKQRGAFISYSRKDKDFTLELARELRSAGYLVWLDQLDIPTGARWDDEVEKALREYEIFLIILTPASVASENVKDEIAYAIDHGKRIMPLLLEECDVPLRLRRFQYIDFTKMEFSEGIRRATQLLEVLVHGQSTSVVTINSKSDRQKALNQGEQPSPNKKKPIQRRWVSIAVGICALGICIGAVGIIFRFRDSIFPSTPTREQSIIGLWERKGPEYTEQYNLQQNGTYTIEARYNSTNEVAASSHGTFTHDNSYIYYVDKDNQEFTDSYYLDNGGDLLVINDSVELAWTRIK